MDSLQAPPHGRREVRSYTANRRELRFGVVAAEAASGCLLAMGRSSAFDPKRSSAPCSRTYCRHSKTIAERIRSAAEICRFPWPLDPQCRYLPICDIFSRREDLIAMPFICRPLVLIEQGLRRHCNFIRITNVDLRSTIESSSQAREK